MRRRAADLLLGAFGRVEDGDLADVRFAEVHADAVDQHALADRQRRLHRAAGDAVGLDDPAWMPSARPSATSDDHDQLDDRARCVDFDRFGAAFHAGSSPADGAPRSPSASREGSASAVAAGRACGRGGRRRPRPAPRARCRLPRRSLRLRRCGVLPVGRLLGAPRPAAGRPARRRPRAPASAASCSSTVSSAVMPVRVGRLRRLVQQPRLDRLLGAGVAALAHARALADAVAQVVELRAAHVAARGELDALDLRRVHREHALHADAEGLLAHGERLARAVALALDHDALEDLHAAARALDHLEVHLDAVARREVGNAAQLRALDGFDDAAHDVKEGAP